MLTVSDELVDEYHQSTKWTDDPFVREEDVPPTLTKFRLEAILEIKAKLGTMTDCRANRMVVQSEVLKYCALKKVRPSHSIQHVPIIVALFFIPTEAEIIAYKIDMSTRRRELLRDAGISPKRR